MTAHAAAVARNICQYSNCRLSSWAAAAAAEWQELSGYSLTSAVQMPRRVVFRLSGCAATSQSTLAGPEASDLPCS